MTTKHIIGLVLVGLLCIGVNTIAALGLSKVYRESGDFSLFGLAGAICGIVSLLADVFLFAALIQWLLS